MTITATSKTFGTSAADASSYASASVTIPNNTVALVVVQSKTATGHPNAPTISGASIKNVAELTHFGWDTLSTQTRTITAFVCQGTGSAGAITIAFAGQTQMGAAWAVVQCSGSVDSARSGTVLGVQVVGLGAGDADQNMALANYAPLYSGDAEVAFYCTTRNEAINAAAGWTELNEAGYTDTPSSHQGRIEAQYKLGDEFSTGFATNVVPNWAGVIIELVDTAAPTTHVITVGPATETDTALPITKTTAGAITVRQSNSGTHVAGTTFVATLPVAPLTGNLVVIVSGSGPAVTGRPASFLEAAQDATQQTACIIYKVADGDANDVAHSYTVTLGGSNTSSWAIYELAAGSVVWALDRAAAAHATGAETQHDLKPGSTVAANEIAFFEITTATVALTGATITPPTGGAVTHDFDLSSGTNRFAVGHRIYSATVDLGTNPTTQTRFAGYASTTSTGVALASFSATPTAGTTTITVGHASETDTALPVTPITTQHVVIGVATETDLALPILKLGTVTPPSSGGGTPGAPSPPSGRVTYYADVVTTNAELAELDFDVFDFTEILTRRGTWNASLAPLHPLAPLLIPSATVVYAVRDGAILFGGLYWDNDAVGGGNPSLKLKGSDLFGYYDGHRFIRSTDGMTFAEGANEQDVVFTQVDVFDVVGDLIRHAARVDGDVGFNAIRYFGPEADGRSGVLVDETYASTAVKSIGGAITDLADADPGFDFAVTYEWVGTQVARFLDLYYPRRGAVRPGLVFEQGKNVVECKESTRGARTANTIIATGAGSGDAQRQVEVADLSIVYPNGVYPRLTAVVAHRNEQGAEGLAAHGAADLTARRLPPKTHTWVIRETADLGIGAFDVGDTAYFSYHFGIIDVEGFERITSRRVTIDATGTLTMTLTTATDDSLAEEE